MVRLKERVAVKLFYAIIISIPYGAIKSVYVSGRTNSHHISIPYGAIKRESC